SSATPPPAAVSDLAVSTTGPDSVTLSWSAAPGASGYDVYRSLLSGGGFTLAGSSALAGFTVTGLTLGKKYYFVVVSRDTTTGLTGAPSNEVHGIPAFDLSNPSTSWFSLIWPPTITHTISATNPTPSIYGQIWISGSTEAPGPAEGVLAQVGYGPDGSLPGSGWRWSDMTFQGQQGSNDEFIGALLPDQTGDYDYAVRFSADGGVQWWYADLSGPQRSGVLANPGAMTVNASGDTDAPAAPAGLAVTSASPAEIHLSWAASGEGDLAGYEIFRENVSAPGFTLLAGVAAGTTSYADVTVASGATYRYYVKAYDASFNRSAASNVVEAAAAFRQVDVTFHVTVPAFTPAPDTVYITGNLAELGMWNPGAVAATKVDATHWTFTLSVLDGATFDYRFTRGTWDKGEVTA
ncbi:MAG TPA: fibronectin type III domain-containing protein, partial [Gemmatimonadaceae bacterium]|nr:fibronectin type III domain-containing protein [Gemmatimonadaceae bacterium]